MMLSYVWLRLCPDMYVYAVCLVMLRVPVGFNSSLNPAIDNFFSTVAYRYGHSTINDIILRLDESWDTDPKGHLSMRQAMYNPTVAMEAGIEPLIRGLLVQPQGRVEPRWVTSISGNWLGDGAINGECSSALCFAGA